MSHPSLLLQSVMSDVPARYGLRWDIASIAIASVLLVSGFAAIALFLLRRGLRESSVLYFGLFSSLYAIRLFLETSAVTSAFEIPASVAVHLSWTITLVIGIPFTLFLLKVFGDRWRNWLVAILIAQGTLAILGEISDFAGHGFSLANDANNVLVIASFVILFLIIILLRLKDALTSEIAVLGAGYFVFALFVFHTNLVRLGLNFGRSLEPVGFFIFAICLGYVAAHRSLGNEQELRSVRKELEIASQIQSSILPNGMPELIGAKITARYVPMSAVAGDFYDFLVLDANRVGILVADVTGHGVPAALIASMVKVAFAAQFAHAYEPARVLSGLNQALCGKFQDHFVTAAYVFVDTRSGFLSYSGAGHPPLLVRSESSETVREVEENGLFLGCFPEAEYSSVRIPVESRDRCILYTDGVVECANRLQVEFGQSRLKAFLEGHRSDSADDFADALLGEIGRWSERRPGEGHADDVTFVIIDFAGIAETGNSANPRLQTQ